MSEQQTSGIGEHRTVSRVAAILEFTAQAESGVRMSEIVKELEAPRSSVHGLVHGLVAAGYLHATDSGQYTLGAAIGALLTDRSPVDRTVREAMEGLNLEFDETVAFVVTAGGSIVTIDAIESSMAIRYNPTIGLRRPLYPTSAGKCFLSAAAEEYRERYLERAFSGEAEREGARHDLAQVSRDGFAMNHGDTLPDLHAVSVPVFYGENVKGVITIAGPSSRFERKRNEILNASRVAADRAGRD